MGSWRQHRGSAAEDSLASAAAPTLLQQHMGYPLFPGGQAVRVTYASRGGYIQDVITAALAPYAYAAKCLRAGLASVIPERALSLCSWWDLRRLVSGEPDIDVDNLKRNSKYE